MNDLPQNVGDIVANRYRIDDVLGHGGMGIVFAATRLHDGAPVAVKFVRDLESPDAERRVRRLVREAHAAMSLRSVHSVRVLELEATHRGVPFVAMERLHGETVAARLQREMLDPATAAQLMAQVCSALAEAHGLGLVHRDVSPGNIFLCSTSEGHPPLVKVLDFGLTKDSSDDVSDVTHQHQVAGSPPYMSPEQVVRGLLDGRSDLWSVGVVLQQMVTGELPFTGSTSADVFTAILTQPPRPVPDRVSVPPRLLGLLARCLRKDPRERFSNAEELRSALLVIAGTGSKPPSVRDSDEGTTELPDAAPPWRS
jgi:serine/threonine-protein kinase